MRWFLSLFRTRHYAPWRAGPAIFGEISPARFAEPAAERDAWPLFQAILRGPAGHGRPGSDEPRAGLAAGVGFWPKLGPAVTISNLSRIATVSFFPPMPASANPLIAGFTEPSNIFRIVLWTVFVSIYAAGVAWLDSIYGYQLILVAPTFHTLLGALLGTLLVFRTNTANDRWWEGRKLWGQLVNECRNFAVKIETCVRAEPRDKAEVAGRLWAFSLALKQHLRGVARLRELPTFEDDPADPEHVPSYVAAKIYDRLERWRQSEQLGGFELLFLDRHAAALLDICGGCERIRNTPIAPTYRRFIRHAIGIYLLTLPWGLVDQFHWWLIPITALVGYFMVGVEILAEDVEEPFGTGYDDLRLDDLCATIERSVREIVLP